MPLVSHQLGACHYIPHLNSLTSARDDATAIGRPAHRTHTIGVLPITHECSPCSRIPYLHRPILRTRGDTATIRRPTSYICSGRVTSIGKKSSTDWKVSGL